MADLYDIVTVDPLASEAIYDLLQRDYRFHDRVLYIEIDLKNYIGREYNGTMSNLDIRFEYSEDYEEDVYSLAHSVFPTDRRFHKETVFDQAAANIEIDKYINHYKSKGAVIFKAKHDDKLLGYTILDESADPRGIFFENVLGVTEPGIKGKMIASSLYSGMLAGQAGKFKKYLGKVSSSNAASINLHFQMGGRVSTIRDEYIK